MRHDGGVLAILVWFLFLPIVGVLIGARDPAGVVLLMPLLPLMFPWLLARTVAIPLGLPRAAYLLARLSEVVLARDRAGGAAFAAAWAVLRRPRPVPWLDRRLATLGPTRGAAVAAAGLRAAALGDDEGARLLLASVALVDRRAVPPAVARAATEWLAAEAAERGDWPSVRGLRGTRATRVLAVCAARFCGEPVPDEVLRRMRRFAPRLLRPLVDQALAWRPLEEQVEQAEAEEAPAQPFRDAAGTPLSAAFAAHGALLAAAVDEVDSIGLADAARRWDEALGDEATRQLIDQRARVLGVRTAPALTQLAATAAEDLADLALASGAGLGNAAQGTAAAAATRLRARLLADVEHGARDLAVRGPRRLPPLVEWRDVMTLRAACARAGRLAGLDARRLVFEDVHAAVCPLACRLWNERGQRVLADALFRWLLSEAEAVGATRLADHERKNVGLL